MHSLFFAVIFSLTVLANCTVQAQDAVEPETSTTVRELVEAEKLAEKVAKEAEETVRQNPYATPLSAILTARRKIIDGDIESASDILDMRYLDEPLASEDPGKLLMRLVSVWTRYDILNIAELSDDPSGHQNDGLPSYRDLLGRMDTGQEVIELYMQRVPDKQHGKIWKISNHTVRQIPALWDKYGYSDWAVKLGDYLPNFSVLTLQNWQIALIAMILIGAYPLTLLIVYLIEFLLRRLSPLSDQRVAELFHFAFKAFLYIFICRQFVQELGLSLKARVIVESAGGVYLMWAFLLIGWVDIAQQLHARRLEQRGRAYVVALLRPLAVTLKVLIVIVCLLLWAQNAGYNMSTIIAGLGVGSVAVALAAQKTFENIIGAFTIFIARPIKPGDFCRFGKVVGTVEEVGLRSTAIRTLDRSIVYIPNSVFAANEVENYSVRDKIRHVRQLNIDPLTSADQVRVLMAEMRKLFLSHPRVEQDTIQIRFEEYRNDALQLRVVAYLMTTQFDEYLRIAEDLNFRMLELIEQLDIRVARPRQTLELTRQQKQGSTRDDAEALIRQWREEDRLPFPDYNDEQTDALRGTLDYPPAGSSVKS